MSDVDSSSSFGHVCLQLLSEFLLGEPVKVSLLPLYFLYPFCFFNFTSPPLCDFTQWENWAESYEPPTLPWLLLFFSFCHLASNHHLEIHPTIKSFSRNLAPQSRNTRRSRSGWAVQIQSWRVFTLLFLQSVIRHGLGRQTQRWRRQVKATSIQNRHHHQQGQQQW